MHILHIISSLKDGGAEAVLYRLCTNDPENQNSVICLTDSAKFGQLLMQAGVEVHCLGMHNGTLNLRALTRLWFLIRSKRPDVVQTWMYHANLIGGICARVAGVSAVVWGIHNSSILYSKTKLSTILLAHLGALLSRVIPQTVVYCANQAAQVHLDIGYTNKKIRVIPNGFSLAKFCPDRESGKHFCLELGIESDLMVLGMVGRFDVYKDHSNLFQALSLLKEQGILFKFILVGTDLDTRNIQLQVCIASYSLTDDLYLAGPQTNITKVMNALDFHVLSSLSEGFPNVIAEAMACGTPCISTDVGDAALIIGDTGWLVPASNPIAMANSIKIAVKEPLVKRYERGRLARERISTHFSLAQMVEKYLDTYRSLIKLP